jgi:hypothetical protein
MRHPTAERVHIFWDNSNIFIPAQYVASRKEGAIAEREVRIQFDNLFNLAKAGRPIGSAVCVGSVPPELEDVWKRLRATGVTVELYERGAQSRSEQGVDQCLQVHMLRALSDVEPAEVAVVLTGDGAGYEDGVGYYADLQRMEKKGWGIEVISWDIAVKKSMREWAKQVGVFVALEDHYPQVTFRNQIRRSEPLSLKHRPRAVPRHSRSGG